MAWAIATASVLIVQIGSFGITINPFSIREAEAAISPVANAGFETGDFSNWTVGCSNLIAPSCDLSLVSMTVDPSAAFSGQFGASLLTRPSSGALTVHVLQQFTDTSPTYTIALKMVQGSTDFFSGAIITINDSTGRFYQWRGNPSGAVFCPLHCNNFVLPIGQWTVLTLDFENLFESVYGVSPNSNRNVVVQAYADGTPITHIHVDNVLGDSFVPLNQPPVAIAQDVTVSADDDCQASASIDNGSFDPDGDPITLSQSPAGPYSLGITSVTLTVEDDNGASDTAIAIVTVVDTTPPTVTAMLVPVNGGEDDDDEGLFQVQISAADNCDPKPSLTADINGIPVVDGQIVKLELDDEMEVEEEDGILTIEAPSFTLTAVATDVSGNTATATATPTFGGEEEEDDDNNDDNDNDNDNDDNDNNDNDD